MSKGSVSKNNWALFLLLLAGIVIGSFASHALSAFPAFSWLNYGKTFGLTKPFTLNLVVLTLTLGFSIRITLGSIIGIIIATIVYKFL